MKTEIKWKSVYPVEEAYRGLLVKHSVSIDFEDKEGKKNLKLVGSQVVPKQFEKMFKDTLGNSLDSLDLNLSN